MRVFNILGGKKFAIFYVIFLKKMKFKKKNSFYNCKINRYENKDEWSYIGKQKFLGLFQNF
jgi:hypothetical protein